MGKRGGSSWLTAVKRAFRSPSKDTDQKRNTRRKEDHNNPFEPEEEEEKVYSNGVFLISFLVLIFVLQF